MDLFSLLSTATTNPEVTKHFDHAEEHNYVDFIHSLAREVANEERPPEIRQLAAIVFKNCLYSKDEAKCIAKCSKWLGTHADVKKDIRSLLLRAFVTPHDIARKGAAQAISSIAAIDIPNNEWPNLLPTLHATTLDEQAPIPGKNSAVQAVGFIAEELVRIQDISEWRASKAIADSILSILISVLSNSASHPEARLHAAKGLYFAIELADQNMAIKNERDMLISHIITNIQSTSSDLRTIAALLDIVVRIGEFYYDYLPDYVENIAQLTVHFIKENRHETCIPSLEFWSTVCDEEILRREQDEESHQIIEKALGFLTPVILSTMGKQESEDNEDEWTSSMAAGTCLGLMSLCVGDVILEHVLPFVSTHFGDADWHWREAALLAYGCIMQGTSPDRLLPLIKQSLQQLFERLSDSSSAVRDTAAWTLSQIALYQPELVRELVAQGFIPVLQARLKDEPRVAAHVCSVLQLVVKAYSPLESTAPAVALEGVFPEVCSQLFITIDRPDAEERELRLCAYDALEAWIQRATDKNINVVMQIVEQLCNRMKKTFQFKSSPEIVAVQSKICGCLHAVTLRLRSGIVEIAQHLFELYIQLFNHYQTNAESKGSLLGDAVTAISSLVCNLGAGFARYYEQLHVFLSMGISNYHDGETFKKCCYLLGDVARNITGAFDPYLPLYIQKLCEVISFRDLQRELRIDIITVIGDLAANCSNFVPFVEPVCIILNQANCVSIIVDANTNTVSKDEDFVAFVQTLHQELLVVYSNIIHAMRKSNGLMNIQTHVQGIVQFVARLANERVNGETLCSALYLLSDLVIAFEGPIVPLIKQNAMIENLLSQANSSDYEETQAALKFLQKTLNKSWSK